MVTTDEGNVWVMIAADYASRFAWIRRLPDKSADAVVSALPSVIQEFTKEKRAVAALQTDRGREFYGAVSDYTEKHKIQHLVTAPRAPASNGFIERRVGKFKNALQLLWHLRVTPHGEGYRLADPPNLFEKACDVMNRLPSKSLLFYTPAQVWRQDPSELHESHASWTLALEAIAAERVASAQRAWARQRAPEPPTFATGDRVLVSKQYWNNAKGVGWEAAPNWFGPFVVVSEPGDIGPGYTLQLARDFPIPQRQGRGRRHAEILEMHSQFIRVMPEGSAAGAATEDERDREGADDADGVGKLVRKVPKGMDLDELRARGARAWMLVTDKGKR